MCGPALAFFGVYGTAVGHGFISDDFGWIAQSRVESVWQALGLFVQNHGFYRPVVALSFAADYAVFDVTPAGYGWTNLALAVVCVALLHRLLRALGVSRGAAWFAAAVWALNFHGINMALLWISGRTALLLIAGALLAAIGGARGRALVALAGFVLALWSKEEAVVIPGIWLAMWLLGFVERSRARATAAALTIGAVVVLAAYAALRAQSGAMTPATAPSFYRLSLAPDLVARNVLEYADRACTFAVAVSLLAWVILRPARSGANRQQIALGAIWIAAGYAITVWIPSRSSLYACFPSIGTVIAGSALWQRWWEHAPDARRRAALAAVAVVPLVCAPIYTARNERWTDLARLSSACLADIRAQTGTSADGDWLVLLDDRSHRANLQSAFGGLVGDAVRLQTGKALKVWIEPPLEYADQAGLQRPCAQCAARRLVLRDGRLIPAP